MKKHALKSFSILSLIAMLAAAPASAQTAYTMVITIPFDFIVRSKTLPAGKYLVNRVGVSDVLLIRSEDSSAVELIGNNTMPAGHGSHQDRGGLDFNRYGDMYFLSVIRMAGIGERELLKGKLERAMIRGRSDRLAKHVAQPEVVSVLAQ